MLIAFAGPSGAGKTTVVEEIAKGDARVKVSTSYTDRPIKPGEVDGVHYNFVSREQFTEMRDAGKFEESADINGHLYGTPKIPDEAMTDGDLILEIDYQGVAQIRKKFPLMKTVFIFASLPELETRLKMRNREGGEEISRRLLLARRELSEMDKFDAWVENNILTQTIAELRGLITLWRHRLATPACYRDPNFLYREPVHGPRIRSFTTR